MSYELKEKEVETIQRFLVMHPHAKLIRNYLNWVNFNVGDVLIRYRTNEDGREVVENVSNTCVVPKKYKVVFVDEETKIPWIKNINVRGGLGTKITNLAEQTSWTYKVDPEMLDCILLGVNYDPRAQYRRWRADNPDYGGD